MKISYLKFSKLALSMGVLAFSFLFTSCDKEDSSIGTSEEVPTSTLTKLAKSLPKVQIVDKSNQKSFVSNDGITFIDNGDGFSFANSNGPTFSTSSCVSFSEGPSGAVILLDPGAGSLGGGGTVIAGKTSMNIDLAVCFGADEEAFDMGFDFGFDGVSAVIGISGDFEALAENDDPSEEELQDAFHGFAGYYVFDDNANGTYKVLDLDGIEDEEEPTGISFAFVIDIKNGYYYISKSGKLTVNGGSISFNGEYYALKFNFYGDDEIGDDWKSVSGFGQMGCD
jgi:hypothetical protein